jgi:PAS domain S-box-containing protein
MLANDKTGLDEATNRSIDSERIAFAIEAAGVGIWELRLDTNTVYWDSKCMELFGLTEESNISYTEALQFIHPADKDLVMAAVANAFAGENGGVYNMRYRTIGASDQQLRWVHFQGKAHFDNQGKAISLGGIAQNITDDQLLLEQIRAEAKAKENLLKNVTNNSPTGLWLSDKEGGLTYLNKTLTDWTGIAYGQLLGAGWANAIVPEDRQQSAAVFMTAVANRKHYDTLFRITKADGSICWCRAAGDPYYDDNGEYQGYTGFCLDIDELVNGQEALLQSESRFRSVVEQAPMAIGLLKGRNMVIEVGNDNIFDIWGKPRSITGMGIREALPEIAGQGFFELLEQVYDTGQPYFGKGVMAQLVRKNKKEDVYLDFTYTPLRSAAGEVTGVMVMAGEVTDQVLALKALEASEEKLRSVIATAPAAMGLFVGRDLVVELPNKAFIDIVGKGPHIAGKPLREVMPELDSQPFLQILDDVYTTGVMFQSFASQVNIVRNGVMTHNFYNITYTPLRNSQGEVYAILDIAIDVTEEINASRKLEESELLNRSIFYNSPVAKLVFTGEQMLIQTVNENMLAILGRDESVVGKPFMEAMPELLDTPLMGRLLHVYATGETYVQPEEKLELVKFGSPYTGYYNYIYKALKNAAGTIYGVMVTATEVTAQVTARQKIEESEVTLLGAIELAELGTWTIDLATGILQYSNRLRDWFNIGYDETITIERAYQPIFEEDRPLVKQAIMEAIGSTGIYDVEYRVHGKTPAGTKILHAQGKTFFDENGTAYKITGTVQDITKQVNLQLALEQEVEVRTEELQAVNEELTATNEELHESNEQLIRSNNELAQFAHVASHDLQEPLRKIQTFASRVLDAGADELSVKNRDYTQRILNSAKRMQELILDVLDYSSATTSSEVFAFADLNTILESALNHLQVRLTNTHAIVYKDELPVLSVIPYQMEQLFTNLLSNALKFIRQDVQPVITISCKLVKHATDSNAPINLPAPFYLIAIADNGIGFDNQYADRIFQVFQRLHRKDEFGGTGIGLAICKKVAENHRGAIAATGRLNEGATFYIGLPVAT